MRQEYDLDAGKEYVINGNSALLKCQYPSFMADHLQVESWLMDDGTVVTQTQDYGIPLLRCWRILSILRPLHPPPPDSNRDFFFPVGRPVVD